jgi:phytoene/squalene synthetase
MTKVADRARGHLDAARIAAKSGAALASVLPAAVAPAYLKLMTKPAFDPFATRADLPVWRKQLAILGANIRGKI